MKYLYYYETYDLAANQWPVVWSFTFRVLSDWCIPGVPSCSWIINRWRPSYGLCGNSADSLTLFSLNFKNLNQRIWVWQWDMFHLIVTGHYCNAWMLFCGFEDIDEIGLQGQTEAGYRPGNRRSVAGLVTLSYSVHFEIRPCIIDLLWGMLWTGSYSDSIFGIHSTVICFLFVWFPVQVPLMEECKEK